MVTPHLTGKKRKWNQFFLSKTMHWEKWWYGMEMMSTETIVFIETSNTSSKMCNSINTFFTHRKKFSIWDNCVYTPNLSHFIAQEKLEIKDVKVCRVSVVILNQYWVLFCITFTWIILFAFHWFLYIWFTVIKAWY